MFLKGQKHTVDDFLPFNFFWQLLVIIVRNYRELIEITIRHCTRDRRVIGPHILLFC